MKRSALIIIIATAISLHSVAGIKVTSGVKSDGTSYRTTSYIRCNGPLDGGLTQPGTVIIPIPTKLARQYVWHYSLTPAQLREIIASDITNIQPASNKNSPGIKIGKNRMVKAILKALEKIDSRQSLP